MSEDKEISQLIWTIYDAALVPTSRHEAIEKLVNYVGGVAGWVFTRHCMNGTAKIFQSFGLQPHHKQGYLNEYMRSDPISPVILSLAIGEVTSNSIVTPRNQFVTTRFYEEWMKPQGWLDTVFVTLDRSPTEITLFAIARGKREGWADDDVYRRLRVLAPHLRRSVLLSKAIDLTAAQEAMLRGALDRIAVGVLFVDADGRIVHANASASALLADEDFWSATALPRSTDANSAGPGLREAISRAVQADAATASKGGITLPLTAPNGDRYVIHGLSLTSARRQQAVASHWAAAVLFIQRAELGGVGAAEVIARHYSLTPMELRVLLSIIETGDASETAAALAIAVATVKAHLRGLFAKTGASRQLELARLVAGFSSALSS
jgi:DNA-binding CsgD family transcriptional regulator/PAS domain-containing protein